MTLIPGSRLGPYEISARIGAGGMGEVFRARDTKLNREVAIKVLPAAFTQDVERVARFRREAQILASLNHPSIAAIYGLEESEGTLALALEFVEGEDIAARLRRGAIPVDEAVAIAKQVAEALEEAHERGVVHRDLKPANVKVGPDGKVKVLDFGLAKAYAGEAAASSPDLSQSPTLARTGTETGIILGTAAYMSPEQARGKPVDKRADIWSFGVVLFEVLTGRRLFSGETVSDTLAAVLREEVPWSSLPPQTPRGVVQLLRRCLTRDARLRLRDIGEARFALSDPLDSPAAAAPPSGPPATAPGRRAAQGAALALVVVAAAVAGASAWARLRPSAPSPVTRFTIPLPPGQILAGNGGPAITRDGRTLAYVARDAGGVARLHIRSLDRFESTVVPDSETAQQPFFSPDGTRVGFFARGKLVTAAVSGGAPTSIADASYQTFGGAWGEDDTIVFVPTLMSGLLRMPSSGGKPQALTEPDGAAKGYAHVFPQLLPGGRRVLFTVWGGPNMDLAGTAVLALDSLAWNRVAAASWQATYASAGYLLVGGPKAVTAEAFDPDRPRPPSARTLAIDDVFSTPNISLSWFGTSATGTLAYVPGDPSLGTLAWVDRNGVVSPIADKPSRIQDPNLSPDGTRIAFAQDLTLWTMDVRRGTLNRLTLDDEGTNRFAVWSHDGARVIFSSNRSGEWDMYSAPAGGGKATPVLSRLGIQLPLSQAPDGTLLFAERVKGLATDLFMLAPGGEVTPFAVSPFSKVGAQFSPDGRLVAYVSDETGRDEVYVRSAARADDLVAVSAGGGRSPRWSPDGKEIVYRRGDVFLAASVASNRPLSVGDSRKLFELRATYAVSTQQAGYAVSPDGKRFLVVLPDPRANPTQINVVLNWFEELKAKVPPR